MDIFKRGFSIIYGLYIESKARFSTGWRLFYSKKLKLNLLLNLDNLIDFLIFEKGVFEKEVIAAIDNIGKEKPFIFIDAGSQLGQFSLYVANKYPQAEVLSFEPYKPVHYQQRMNMQMNQLNYALYECALSSVRGDFLLYSPHSSCKGIYGKTNPGMASLLPDLLFQPNRSSVVTAKLDDFKDFFEKHQCIMLKIDVEGGESLVLDGGINLIQSKKEVFIIVELLFESLPERAMEVDDFLQKNDFKPCNVHWKIEKLVRQRNGNFFYRRFV